jgi:hypothetical protein
MKKQEAVREISKLLQSGFYTKKEIAERLKISDTLIKNCIHEVAVFYKSDLQKQRFYAAETIYHIKSNKIFQVPVMISDGGTLKKSYLEFPQKQMTKRQVKEIGMKVNCTCKELYAIAMQQGVRIIDL